MMPLSDKDTAFFTAFVLYVSCSAVVNFFHSVSTFSTSKFCSDLKVTNFANFNFATSSNPKYVSICCEVSLTLPSLFAKLFPKFSRASGLVFEYALFEFISCASLFFVL